MRIKIMWIAVSMVVLLHLTIQFLYFKPSNNTDVSAIAIFLLELAVNFTTIALFGLIPALIISAIPFKEKSYIEKFKLVAPVCLLIITVILVSSFGYTAYFKQVSGIELRPVGK